MTDKRSQLAELKNRIEKIEIEARALHDESFSLQESSDLLVCSIILEEKLLSDTKWEIDSYNNSIYLKYIGEVSDQELIKVVSLIPYDHAWFSLEEDIQIRFEDTEISIHFDDIKLFLPFVNKHALKISGKMLINRMRELNREISVLKEINHQFNLKG